MRNLDFSNKNEIVDKLIQLKYNFLRIIRKLSEADDNKESNEKSSDDINFDFDDSDTELDAKVSIQEFLLLRYLKNNVDYLMLIIDFLRTLYGDDFNILYKKILKVRYYLNDFIRYFEYYEDEDRQKIYKAFKTVLLNIIKELLNKIEQL